MFIRQARLASTVAALLAAAPAIAQPADPAPDQPTDPAPAPAPAPVPPPAVVVVDPPAMPVKPADKPEMSAVQVKGKWDFSMYGFVQLYGIYDTTQGFNEQAQNGAIPRPKQSYGADHGQFTLSGRHSRLGLKLAGPVVNDIKPSAQFEMDFLGNQPANPPGITESAFFQNGTMRFRHAFAKLETPVVDILAGQYWSLFGWQSTFHPNSVEIQGLPGQVYKRVAQLRLGKTIKSDAVNVDIAIAAQRPPQRASSTPDGEAGIKLTLNKLKAWHTKGANDSGLDGAAIGVSVIGRRFAADEFLVNPSSQIVKNGYGLSIDAIVPLIPATKESHANALTLTGSFVTGAAIADQYDGLTFATSNPAAAPDVPNPNPKNVAYVPNVDNGLVLFTPDSANASGFSLHPIQVQTYMVGAQYYLPPAGKVWLSANYTHANSPNAHLFGNQAKIWDTSTYVDGMIFADLTSAFRIGVAFEYMQQTFVAPDAANNNVQDATNYRVNGTMMMLF